MASNRQLVLYIAGTTNYVSIANQTIGTVTGSAGSPDQVAAVLVAVDR